MGHDSARRSNTDRIGSNYAVSRHSYHWLMTKHAWVKKKIVADNDGAADCSCNEPEAQWHIMGMPIRKRYSRYHASYRQEMMDKIGIPTTFLVWVNLGTTKYEHGATQMFPTTFPTEGQLPWFSGALFRKQFSTVVFQRSIFKNLRCLLTCRGVGTDPLRGRFQLLTPNRSIGL